MNDSFAIKKTALLFRLKIEPVAVAILPSLCSMKILYVKGKRWSSANTAHGSIFGKKAKRSKEPLLRQNVVVVEQ